MSTKTMEERVRDLEALLHGYRERQERIEYAERRVLEAARRLGLMKVHGMYEEDGSRVLVSYGDREPMAKAFADMLDRECKALIRAAV